MAPTFLPGGSLRLSATGACDCYYPVIKEGCAVLGIIASTILALSVMIALAGALLLTCFVTGSAQATSLPVSGTSAQKQTQRNQRCTEEEA
jgi:hypothetical protein